MAALPKIIWMYWHQGEKAAPEVVRRCIASWRVRNPDWSVQVLDAASVQEPTGLSADWINGRPDISLQFLSDIIRIALLSRHGGVWADASVYCSQPLEDWLPQRMQSGFFAFEGIRRGRMIGSPFLAAQPGNIVPARILSRLLEMFQGRRFTGNEVKYGQILRAVLKAPMEITPGTTRLWFSTLFTDVLKIYPYFTLHYMFNKLVLEDAEFADLWSRTPRLPSGPFVKIKRAKNLPAITEDIRQFITTEKFPVHKLNWQADMNAPYWAEVFRLLDATVRDEETGKQASGG
jgi:hypothetical protein